LKIALVHKRLDLNGGTERDLYQTAEGLRDLGHQVHLFCSEYGVAAPRGTIGHTVPVVRMGRTLRLWSFALVAPRIIKNHRCDLVVSFGRLLSQDILRSGGGTHRGFLLRMGQQGGVWRRLWQRLSLYHQSLLRIERKQFSDGHFKKVIAVSDEVKCDIESNYQVKLDKIEVIYNGVDQQRFHPSRRARVGDTLRARWKVPHQAPLVLFVGSGFARKGLDRLIAIWHRPLLSQTYLMVAGDDGRMGHYQNWANSVAGDRILFVGRQDDIENYYAMADLVALPALQEAFGNVVLESLSSGVPVVVSREVGAGALLTGCLRQGVVEDAGDATQLEARLSSMLEQCVKPEFRIAARQLGEQYSWNSHLHRLEAVLNEVCQGLAAIRVS
jgi:UDP-glucose:(heptosyl)LPS alpha-1,3-glucosyltransferase